MKMEFRYKISKKIVTIALLGVIMLCSSFLIHFYDPLQMIIRQLLDLAPGTILYGLWKAPPYDLVMKLYIFNVTNAEEFLSGKEKLNVTEVGPYGYKEILTHNNVSFSADGTVSYNPKRVFTSDPTHSVGDPLLDRITVPNIPLLGIQAYLTDSSFITNMGFSALAASLGSNSILNLTVDEFMWGYEDKLVTMANQFLPNWIDFGKFGLLERLMSRDNVNRITVSVDPTKATSKYDNLLTQEEITAPYHIVRWNGSPGLKEWGFNNETMQTNKKCELIEGAFDGTIFPRKMRRNRTITVFRKAFCRPVPFHFVGDSLSHEGFVSYDFKMKKNVFGTPEENPYNECYCFKGTCPGKGLQTIAPCYYDMPIILSEPHFLNVDPEIRNSVNGMNPDEKIHASLYRIQPDLGVPLAGSALRVQVNLGMGQTRYNSKTRQFNNMTVPLFWIELSFDELPGMISFLLRLVLVVLPVGQTILIYLLGIIGFAMVSGAALLTLFFNKIMVPRSLSIASEYTALPAVIVASQYFKPDVRISKSS
ncbi:unnamed protein product [Acanthoscelides obtectus]|uniref:Uncharacterized protein n=2 Tax=Acanthoscelides obtectus TaxID=200917 RepID=A0A9P0M3F5_ACAOB|nr:unnamed protein product [Acanthoscelides obtectus]CAK1665384.1 Scavenger receptor class B member 1 [Acanthoscelides obtectus]